ncbi:hypothetical protein BH18THE2_BH18THE2_34120 [soil metagenome]
MSQERNSPEVRELIEKDRYLRQQMHNYGYGQSDSLLGTRSGEYKYVRPIIYYFRNYSVRFNFGRSSPFGEENIYKIRLLLTSAKYLRLNRNPAEVFLVAYSA